MHLNEEFPHVQVVLSHSLYAFNIGQCSRAMANLGFYNLSLIAPQNLETNLDLEARQGAARGQTPLRESVIFSSWEGFYQSQPEVLRIGFTRRPGKLRPLMQWDTLLKSKAEQEWFDRPVALIFGPEDAGLNNEELDNCHLLCELPVYGDHGSYNLSQAVLLALFMMRQRLGYYKPKSKVAPKKMRATGGGHPFPEQILKDWLTELGFKLDNRRVSVFSVMKRLLLNQEPTPKELRMLEVVIYQTIRKLRERG